MKKPVIGITPLWDIENEKMWMFSGYYDAIISAGGVPVILPLTSDEECLNSYCEMVEGKLWVAVLAFLSCGRFYPFHFE